jgi:hypothetical protein
MSEATAESNDNNESIEIGQQQEEQKDGTNDIDNNNNRRPYYTYSNYELVSEILDDIGALKDKAHNGDNLWDMARLWLELEDGITLPLLTLKLELLRHFLES